MACVCHCAGNSGSVFDWSWLATQIEESSRLRGSRAVPPDVVVGSQGRCPRVACIPMVNYDGTVLVSARFASLRAKSISWACRKLCPNDNQPLADKIHTPERRTGSFRFYHSLCLGWLRETYWLCFQASPYWKPHGRRYRKRSFFSKVKNVPESTYAFFYW